MVIEVTFSSITPNRVEWRRPGHIKAGGVATAWKRNGYLIDGGIHFLMGHRPGQPIQDLYRELGTARSDCCTDLIGFHFIDEASGVEIVITSDLGFSFY